MEQVAKHGLPQGRGLDLGCGDGLLTRILLQETGPREVVGVDPDYAEAAQAERLGIYAAVHAVGADKVPEPGGSFDWVFSNSVLEHIDDIDPVLAEVARLLRAGGEFVFTVPGPEFHACLRGPLLPGRSRESYPRVTAGVLYGLAARRPQPIQIQRRLGLRKPGRRMPRSLARALATLLAANLNGARAGGSALNGCYLISAVKRDAAQ